MVKRTSALWFRSLDRDSKNYKFIFLSGHEIMIKPIFLMTKLQFKIYLNVIVDKAKKILIEMSKIVERIDFEIFG